MNKITIEQLREKFDWIMAKCPEWSIDNSDDQIFHLYCISVSRLFSHEQLDDYLFQLRCANEHWVPVE